MKSITIYINSGSSEEEMVTSTIKQIRNEISGRKKTLTPPPPPKEAFKDPDYKELGEKIKSTLKEKPLTKEEIITLAEEAVNIILSQDKIPIAFPFSSENNLKLREHFYGETGKIIICKTTIHKEFTLLTFIPNRKTCTIKEIKKSLNNLIRIQGEYSTNSTWNRVRPGQLIIPLDKWEKFKKNPEQELPNIWNYADPKRRKICIIQPLQPPPPPKEAFKEEDTIENARKKFEKLKQKTLEIAAQKSSAENVLTDTKEEITAGIDHYTGNLIICRTKLSKSWIMLTLLPNKTKIQKIGDIQGILGDLVKVETPDDYHSENWEIVSPGYLILNFREWEKYLSDYSSHGLLFRFADEKTRQKIIVREKKYTEEELYESAKRLIIESDNPSVSFIQRKLDIGYNTAYKIIERLEKEGFVSSMGEKGKRTILKKK